MRGPRKTKGSGLSICSRWRSFWINWAPGAVRLSRSPAQDQVASFGRAEVVSKPVSLGDYDTDGSRNPSIPCLSFDRIAARHPLAGAMGPLLIARWHCRGAHRDIRCAHGTGRDPTDQKQSGNWVSGL